jgi:hypothetical protein
MNVWSNFGEKSAAEHAEILSVEANFTSGQHSRPIIAMKQDAMTGGYLLTFGDVVIDKATFFDCIALEHFDLDIMEKYYHILDVYHWKGIYKEEEQKLRTEIDKLHEKASDMIKRNKKYIEEFNTLKTSGKKADRERRETIKRMNESIKVKHKEIKEDIENKKKNFDVIVEERLMFSGRSLFSYLLPNNFEYTFKNDMSPDGKPVQITRGVMLSGTLDKKVLGSSAGSISHQIFLQYNAKKACEFVSYYQMIINRWLLTRGLSVGIEDCVPKLINCGKEKTEIVSMKDTAKLEEHRKKGSKIVEFTKKSYMCVEKLEQTGQNLIQKESAKCFSNALLTIQTEEDEELLEIKINNALNNARDICQKLAKDALEPTNAFVSIIRSGAKGNDNNITQITSMLGQQNMGGMRMQLTFGGRTLPHFKKNWEEEAKTSEMSSEATEKMFQSRGFVTSSFYKGLSPSEFYFHAVGGREGVIDTAIRTANTGYTQRKMIKMMEDLRVNYLGVVETANNKIISFDYGGDNYDGSKVLYKNGKPTFVDIESLCSRLNMDHEWDVFTKMKEDNKNVTTDITNTTNIEIVEDNSESKKEDDNSEDEKEVQYHGFVWEDFIKTNIYKLTEQDFKKINYTSKYDIPADLNKLDSKNVSIKTSGNKKAICMADCLRFYDSVSSDENLSCVVVLYDQVDNEKLLSEIVELDLTKSVDILFKDVKREEIEHLHELVRKVPHKRKPTDEEYNEMYTYRDLIQKKSGYIHFDIKCNSQQSRLQCSITKFQDLLKQHKNLVVERSKTMFKGVSILKKVKSSKRKFNK